MKSYLVDRFPDYWLCHGLREDMVIDTTMVGTGRGPIAALTDLIEKEKLREFISAESAGAGVQGAPGSGD